MLTRRARISEGTAEPEHGDTWKGRGADPRHAAEMSRRGGRGIHLGELI